MEPGATLQKAASTVRRSCSDSIFGAAACGKACTEQAPRVSCNWVAHKKENVSASSAEDIPLWLRHLSLEKKEDRPLKGSGCSLARLGCVVVL